MSSLYAKYILERENKNIIETDSGFATYIIQGEECYIENIFVLEEMRKKGSASYLAGRVTEIAKEMNCKRLIGSVRPSARGSTESLKVLLAYGFKLLSASNDAIFFVKEI
jgi:predicted GNAT family acetyltransferase